MCEITIRDGAYKKGKVTINLVSDSVYDQEVIDAEAKKLMLFLDRHVSSGMCNSLFDIMFARRATTYGCSIEDCKEEDNV